MVKAFETREREMIRQALLEKGRELFATYGLKKTSISDLTRAARIAQGSFYNFFDSKEELYFEILELEEEVLKKSLLAKHFPGGQVTRESFKSMLKEALHTVSQSPLLRRMYMADEYELLVRKLPPEKLITHQERDMGAMLPLILNWQKEGRALQVRPEIITSVFRALFLITLHKPEIGEEFYTETIDLMVELIVNGLILTEGE